MPYPARLNRWIACVLALCVAAGAGAQSELPDIGAAAGGTLSPLQEKRLGEEFMRAVRKQVTLVDDLEVSDYVESLGLRIASNTDHPSSDYTFFVVRHPAINAFAGPGGYIGIHSGLFLAAQNEGELAAVVAHEIAHVTQRHIARTIEAAQRMSLPTAAALLAAILIGTQNPEAGQAAILATQAGAIQHQINFTRANEEEADRIGIQALARAGFDPRGMPAFFERLQQVTRYYDRGLPEYLSTHPVTTARIAESRARAEALAPKRPVADSLDFLLTRARLEVLVSEDPGKTTARFDAALKESRGDALLAARYGRALSLQRAGRWDEARVELKRLLAEDPDRIQFRLAMARNELAGGDTRTALKLFANTERLYPGNHAVTLAYAGALLDTGRAEEALALLQRHLRRRPQDPVLYGLLARAAGAAGRTAESHQYLAEQYYLTGATGSAIEHLKRAAEAAKEDFYLSAQIQARLKEVQALAK